MSSLYGSNPFRTSSAYKVILIKCLKKQGIYLHVVTPDIMIVDTSGKYVGIRYTIWSDINPLYNQEDIILMKLLREGDIDNTLL